jgi:carboxypeptidase C (cathepsin A)
VHLWHGLDDAILFNLGDRITIQNLTWGGLQGYQTAPSTPLLLNGAQKGIYHTERNLTYMEVNSAGHMIPEDQPGKLLSSSPPSRLRKLMPPQRSACTSSPRSSARARSEP